MMIMPITTIMTCTTKSGSGSHQQGGVKIDSYYGDEFCQIGIYKWLDERIVVFPYNIKDDLIDIMQITGI